MDSWHTQSVCLSVYCRLWSRVALAGESSISIRDVTKTKSLSWSIEWLFYWWGNCLGDAGAWYFNEATFAPNSFVLYRPAQAHRSSSSSSRCHHFRSLCKFTGHFSLVVRRLIDWLAHIAPTNLIAFYQIGKIQWIHGLVKAELHNGPRSL